MGKKKTIASKRRGRALKKYFGEVVVGLVHPDSKSERQAVKLDTGENELIMRRPGIRAYKDEVLEGLVGQRVTFKGLKRGNKLYVKSWEVLDGDEPEKDDEKASEPSKKGKVVKAKEGAKRKTGDNA
ncbi:MAG: hypothetical protein AB8G18_19295 [Gammaproteobacteria bacterium]